MEENKNYTDYQVSVAISAAQVYTDKKVHELQNDVAALRAEIKELKENK